MENSSDKVEKEESSLEKSADSIDPEMTYREKSSIALLASKYENGEADTSSSFSKSLLQFKIRSVAVAMEFMNWLAELILRINAKFIQSNFTTDQNITN